ncbi:uncharacterized protein [Diadema antillarum]|uniref:uncharacterized protein n=1 Tax=Diadema antillarum TaxID=105358 RepID=UPI003A8A4AB5
MPKVEGKGLCNGFVYELEHQGCCNGQVYTLYMEQCCGDILVLPRYDEELRPLQCCEDVAVYNSETESCITDRIWPFPKANARECGFTWYDNREFGCRDNELVPYGAPPGIRFCGVEQPVQYDESEQECCGGQLIGPGQTCCNGIIHSTPGTPLKGGRCCGYAAYNPTSQVCCLDQVHDGDVSTTACCRGQAYDTTLSNITCCGGRLQRRSPEDTECSKEHGIVHRPDEIVCDMIKRRRNNDHEQCCGTELYNPLNEQCCDGFRYDMTEGNACCGKQVYRTDSMMCCDKVLYEGTEGRECCGHSSYDPKTQECFTTGGKQFVLGKEGEARHAFCNSSHPDSANQTCCDGILYNGIVECCGNQAITDPSTFCCSDQVQMKIHGDDTTCCPSGRVINRRIESCDAESGENGWPLLVKSTPLMRPFARREKSCNTATM